MSWGGSRRGRTDQFVFDRFWVRFGLEMRGKSDLRPALKSIEAWVILIIEMRPNRP